MERLATAIDPNNIRLGKHLGVVHDRRTFMARGLIDAAELPAHLPRVHQIGGQLRSVPVFLNDNVGDCTCASKGHAVVTMERSSGQREIEVSDADVVRAYSRISGYDPVTGANDDGAYELDSLNDWRQNGLGRERDGTAHTIYAFAAVEPSDHLLMRQAHYVFNGLKVCAGLPLSAADQLRTRQPWDVSEGPRARFGSWGGHSMYSYGWTPHGLLIWTWGEPVLMTWEFVDRYVDEVYAVISEDAIRRSGKTHQGFDVTILNALLRNLR